MMNKIVSNKIKILSFFCICMVVFRHAYNLRYSTLESKKGFVYYIENLFSSELGNIVVIPIFFFISGYLFFYNHDFKSRTFVRKLIKRFKTLLVPYLIWCLFWFFTIYMIQYVPNFSIYFDQPLNKMTISNQLWLAFVDPINYPFWFIRELLFFSIVTPLIYFGIKYLKIFYLLIILGLVMLKEPSLIRIYEVSLFQFLGFLFFSIGAYTSIEKKSMITKFKDSTYFVILLLWTVSIGLGFYLKEFHYENYWILIVSKRINAFVGFFAIWCFYDFLNKKINFKNREIYSYTFFIFASHGIFIAYTTKLYTFYYENNVTLLLFFYFLIPLLTIALCIRVAKLIQTHSPFIYAILTGFR